jgi:undecaprenyl-diphosphatase
MAWFVVIGTIPGGIVGILAESKIDALFHQPGVPISPLAIIIMAVIIALLGSALFIADRVASHVKEAQKLTLKEVLIIGFAQALAVFPGVSRSGSTITAGLGLGLKRDAAAKFSFLLSAPIIAGAGLKSLFDVYHALKAGSIASGELLLFPIGMIAAAISGYLCIGFLMSYLQKHRIDIFVFYRWALAVFIAVVALLR